MAKRVIVVSTEEPDAQFKGVIVLDRALPMKQAIRLEKQLALRGLYITEAPIIETNPAGPKCLVDSVIEWAVRETGIVLAGED